MTKLTLTSPGTLANEPSFLAQNTANNDAVVAAIEDTLSRSGASPNSMAATLDMNSNRIINLPAPLTNSEPARLQDIPTAGPQNANLVMAGPTTGSAATPTFRSIVAADLPIGSVLQGYNADLTTIAGLSSTGILSRTGSGTWAQRTIVAGTGVSVSNGDGVSGNPTISITPAGSSLVAANNLSDLGNVVTARTNLGLGSAALVNTTAFLTPSNNLSDVTTASTARTNLGLGTVATHASTDFLSSTLPGSSGYIQYNNSGVLGASANLVWSGSGLGIGTASPSFPVDIRGQLVRIATADFASGTTGSSLQIGFGASSGNTYASIDSFTGGSTAFGTIALHPTGNGNVSIGSGTPTAQFDTTGTVRFRNFGAGPAHFDSSGNLASRQGALNILDFGGNPNGTSSPNTNDTPWTNALAAAASAGISPCVYFPPGKYYFSSQTAYTFPSSNTTSGLTVKGDGPDVSQLYWPASHGLVVTVVGPAQALHVNDISIATGTAGTWTGLQLLATSCPGSSSYAPAQHSFKNVVFQGRDTASHYWGSCAILDGISFTSWDTIGLYGNKGASPTDNGITIQNTGNCTTAIWHNMTSIAAGGGNWSIVLNGNNIQGLDLNHSNFQDNNGGVAVVAGATGGDQISISDCTFNPAPNGFGIGINSPQSGSNIHHNNFYLNKSGSLTFGIILNTAATNYSTIDHNQFFGVSSGGTADGIYLAGGSSYNIIDANIFYGMTTAISLNSGSNNCKGSNNLDAGGNTTMIFNGGTGNTVS